MSSVKVSVAYKSLSNGRMSAQVWALRRHRTTTRRSAGRRWTTATWPPQKSPQQWQPTSPDWLPWLQVTNWPPERRWWPTLMGTAPLTVVQMAVATVQPAATWAALGGAGCRCVLKIVFLPSQRCVPCKLRCSLLHRPLSRSRGAEGEGGVGALCSPDAAIWLTHRWAAWAVGGTLRHAARLRAASAAAATADGGGDRRVAPHRGAARDHPAAGAGASASAAAAVELQPLSLGQFREVLPRVVRQPRHNLCFPFRELRHAELLSWSR